MGKFSSEINYWIKTEDSDYFNINVLSTECTKVPEVGEIIYINNKIDEDWLDNIFGDERWMTDYESMGFRKPPHIPEKEEMVRGHFKVVEVSRTFRVDYYRGSLADVFTDLEGNQKKAAESVSIPISITREIFEVFIEPVAKD